MTDAKPLTRRHDIDRLRIFAILVVFFFHCLLPFVFGLDWNIINSDKSLPLAFLALFFDTWQMPFFFLLSGAGSWYALKHRTSFAYVRDRIKRLLVPFYTVGITIIAPPIIYITEISHGRFSGSFLESFSSFFTVDLHKVELLFPDKLISSFTFLTFTRDNVHLWFLYTLFFLSLFTLPIMAYLKGPRGKVVIEKLASICMKRGGVFLFIIPCFVAKFSISGFSNSNYSWAGVFHYAFFFLFGFVMVADTRFAEALKRDWWIGIVVCVVSEVIADAAYFLIPDYQQMVNTLSFSLLGIAFWSLIRTITGWGFMVFLLGAGVRFWNQDKTPALAYANEAVLPFYILHMTFIVVLGYFVVQLNLSILIKFLIITIPSFALSLGAYELLVRRWNPIRFLFGMKMKKKPESSIQSTE